MLDVFIHLDSPFGSIFGLHKFIVDDIRKMTKHGGK